MTVANDPAYPLRHDPRNCENIPNGLTKREYFAAMAMQGLCVEGAYSQAIQRQCERKEITTSQAIAVYAVDIADAIIEELNQVTNA